MARNFTETVGLINNVLAYMADAKNQTALAGRDFPVGPHVSRLAAEVARVNALNAE